MTTNGITTPSYVLDSTLLLLADALDDIERIRIANQNRLRQLEQQEDLDPNIIKSGKRVSSMSRMVDNLLELEDQSTKELKTYIRESPYGPWIKKTIGVGEKQGARLLAAMGDPYWNHAENRPRRGPSELWAYCGLHVSEFIPCPGCNSDVFLDANYLRETRLIRESNIPDIEPILDCPKCNRAFGPSEAPVNSPIGVAPKRVKGQKSNWNAKAKMRAFLIAESCIKQKTSPYRVVYTSAREHYRDAVHRTECRQCGPKGNPAKPGDPLNDGHKHARGLRKVSKAMLKHLWIQGQMLHEEASAPKS